MKLLLIMGLLALLISTSSATDQTNAFYGAKDLTIRLAPTISSYVFKAGRPTTIGYSYETEFWTALNFGTGLEIGNYDYRSLQVIGPVDHIAIMQDFRVIPFNRPIFDRLAGEIKFGAETYFIDGTKDLQIGLGSALALTKVSRLTVDFTQHFRTNPALDGWTLTAGLQWRF